MLIAMPISIILISYYIIYAIRSIKEKSFVILNVYNITGNLIKTLINQTKDPGSYETEFNAKGLPSGVYFYRLEVFGKSSSPVYSDTKKTILLK